jgi:hypothetical protein
MVVRQKLSEKKKPPLPVDEEAIDSQSPSNERCWRTKNQRKMNTNMMSWSEIEERSNEQTHGTSRRQTKQKMTFKSKASHFSLIVLPLRVKNSKFNFLLFEARNQKQQFNHSH